MFASSSEISLCRYALGQTVNNSETKLFLGVSCRPFKTSNHSLNAIFRRSISSNNKFVIRKALDLGSGRFKIHAGLVDPVKGQLLQTLVSADRVVPLSSSLTSNKEGIFSQEIQDEAIKAILSLLDLVPPLESASPVGIATEAVRNAKNSAKFLKRIERETGVKIYVIPSHEEGLLGFETAVSLSGIEPAQAIVWDMGAASTQIVTLDSATHSPLVYMLPTGVSRFKDAVLKIQGKTLEKTSSPNPISRLDLDLAFEHIATIMQSNPMPEALIEKIGRKDSLTLGLGAQALLMRLKKEPFHLSEVTSAIEERLGLNDEAITVKDNPRAHSVDSGHVVSDLILQQALMKSFGITSIKFVYNPGGNAAGVLVSPKYWNPCSNHGNR